MFVESARGETSTPSFTQWAGDERVTLAIVFTDIVGSTLLGEELKDERMNKVRRAHFLQSRKLIDQYKEVVPSNTPTSGGKGTMALGSRAFLVPSPSGR